MNTEEMIRMLKPSPLFQGIPPEALNVVFSCLKPRVYTYPK